jgi:hypothetical protein
MDAEGRFININIPGKCACTSCDGAPADCDNAFWKPLSDSGACPEIRMDLQPGEQYSTTVYSHICRQECSGCAEQGRTGYLKDGVCKTFEPNKEPPSVFCPQRP